MSFEISQTVVYRTTAQPRSERPRARTIRGGERTYLRKLRVNQGDLEIKIYAGVDLVGVRDIVDPGDGQGSHTVLRAPEEPTNWSRRFKADQGRSRPATLLHRGRARPDAPR